MNKVEFLKNRLTTGSGSHLWSRAFRIVSRYGFGAGRFIGALSDFVKMMTEHGITPTLPLTASVLNRHPKLFQDLQKDGVEFAIHGFRHVDYTLLSIDEVRVHLRRAVDIFNRHRIQFNGFRFPFLRHDTERMDLLEEFILDWDSSQAVSWDLPSWEGLTPESVSSTQWQNYFRILESYRVNTKSGHSWLPYMRGSILEIPVCMPDDDILIDRMGFHDQRDIASVWIGMAANTRDKEELLVLQTHPERFFSYREGLRAVLDFVAERHDIWVASLVDIARWWRERQSFRWDIIPIRQHKYRIVSLCKVNAGCWVKEGSKNQALPFGKKGVQSRTLEMEFPVRPAVGIHPSIASTIKPFVVSEGWAVHETESSETCGVYLGPDMVKGGFDRQTIRDRINTSSYPLLKYGLWPDGYRCALSVTGDIDSVDLIDYWGRLYG